MHWVVQNFPKSTPSFKFKACWKTNKFFITPYSSSAEKFHHPSLDQTPRLRCLPSHQTQFISLSSSLSCLCTGSCTIYQKFMSDLLCMIATLTDCNLPEAWSSLHEPRVVLLPGLQSIKLQIKWLKRPEPMFSRIPSLSSCEFCPYPLTRAITIPIPARASSIND